jgi:mono/diheme cytochrome c family protein
VSAVRGFLGVLAIAAVLVVVFLMMAGSGGESLPPVDEEYPAEMLTLGGEVFSDTCSVCHGRGGGGGLGPSLKSIGHRLTFEEHIGVIQNGRGQMPPFSGSLTAEEIEAVVAFERVGLN